MAELTDQQKNFLAVRTRLREACTAARREAALFAVLTILLTPVAVTLFLLTLLFCLAFVDLPVVDYLGYRASFITGANLCLAFMAASYFLRPKAQYLQRQSDSSWLLVAAGLFCAILSLSYLTPLAATHPVWFWSLYLLLALVMLGCIGHAYEPHDDYYIGWTYGPVLVDDPFSIRDDIDRAHIGLGFAVSIAHLIAESYGAIFGSRWLWQGLKEAELGASARLLQGLAKNDSTGIMAYVKGLQKDSAADIVRAMVKLELVRMDRGQPKLSMKGRNFVELRALD